MVMFSTKQYLKKESEIGANIIKIKQTLKKYLNTEKYWA